MTIQNKINILNQSIDNIKDEIIDKGQTVSPSDTVASLSDKIENISNKRGDHYSKNVLKDIIEGLIENLYDTTSIYLRPFLFTGCDNFKIAHFTKLRKIGRSSFYKCYNFKTLILETNHPKKLVNGVYVNQIVKLEDINAFKHTLIEKGLGKIYVPSSLLNDYLNDSVWSLYSDYIDIIDNYSP